MLGRRAIAMTNLAEGHGIKKTILATAVLAIAPMLFSSCGPATTAETHEAIQDACSYEHENHAQVIRCH